MGDIIKKSLKGLLERSYHNRVQHKEAEGQKKPCKIIYLFYKKEIAENHQATDTFKHLISLRCIKVSVY